MSILPGLQTSVSVASVSPKLIWSNQYRNDLVCNLKKCLPGCVWACSRGGCIDDSAESGVYLATLSSREHPSCEYNY